MSSKIEAKEAELALLKAEAAFSEKKLSEGVTDEDKQALRELRREFREKYRQAKPGAAPAAIESKVKVG